ncbi:MAG: SGNH/GDSL hydrolase family protein [Alistipes sp.]
MNKIILFLLALLCACASFAGEYTRVAATSPEIRYVGRTLSLDGSVSFDWSGSYFECRFTGNHLAINVSDTKKNYYNLFIDGQNAGVITTFGRDSVIVLADKLGRGQHTVRMQKRTEGEQGRTTIHAILLHKGCRLLPATRGNGRHIEFIGNSLTCGYGTEALSKEEPFKPETENCDKAYACIAARYFDADYTLIAHSGRGAARNYGDKNSVSANTMADRITNTFDETAAPAWDFSSSSYSPDLVVIHLGSNDFSTPPHPSREEFRTAYKRILTTLRAVYGEHVPILCVAPRVSEPAFTYIRELSMEQEIANLHFAAVLPEYCNNNSELGASAHPNYAGQRKMAMLLIPYISTLTGWNAEIKPIK